MWLWMLLLPLPLLLLLLLLLLFRRRYLGELTTAPPCQPARRPGESALMLMLLLLPLPLLPLGGGTDDRPRRVAGAIRRTDRLSRRRAAATVTIERSRDRPQ